LQLYAPGEAWELGLEADGADALMTIFRAGNNPEVAVFERRVALEILRKGVLDGVGSAASDTCPAALRQALAAAEKALQTRPVPSSNQPRITQTVAITPRALGGLAFRADTTVRVSNETVDTGQVERSDLHALLCNGVFGVTARGRTWNIPEAPVFLVAERLVELAEAAVKAQQSASPLFRRIQVGNLRLGVRLAPADGPLTVSLGGANLGNGQGVTFPELEPAIFAQAVALFVEALRSTIIRCDPSQSRNLRLQNLAAATKKLSEQVRPQQDQGTLLNTKRDAYRRFASTSAPTSGRWEHGAGLRFSPRFIATIPQIDLKSTFHCGDALIVGSQRETSCLDPITGETRWRIATARAAAIGTPSGLMRLFPDGRLALHDIDTGNQRFSLRLTPRAQGGACGAVVYAPGLPRLLAVCEGDRRVTAVDLASGEIRWRYTARRPAPLRVRRAGGLLLVAGGDSVLVALDATSGETVWRACDRLPFTGDISVSGDDVFAVSAGAQGSAWLHSIDAWSGELRWKAEIEDRPILGQNPLLAKNGILIALRDARGCGTRAFCRRTGRAQWNLAPGFFPRSVAWLMVDDALVINSASGTLVCVDASTSALKYRHAFSHGMESDQPRRLDPVLRGGALFVPQHQVHVMRPQDGAVLGVVPSDLVPDLVRVDDRWGVFVV
jgi:outer membrane protein assembly factor BamB